MLFVGRQNMIHYEYIFFHLPLSLPVLSQNHILLSPSFQDDPSSDLKMIDLGLAKRGKISEQSSGVTGTIGYMAPEVMCRQNHGYAVDYFALGVIGYEFMMGRRPYVGRSRKEIRDMIFAKQV